MWWIPGRLEVFGKHTDYAGGRTLVCAIPRGFTLAVRARRDDIVAIVDARSGERARISSTADRPTSCRLGALRGSRRAAARPELPREPHRRGHRLRQRSAEGLGHEQLQRARRRRGRGAGRRRAAGGSRRVAREHSSGRSTSPATTRASRTGRRSERSRVTPASARTAAAKTTPRFSPANLRCSRLSRSCP